MTDFTITLIIGLLTVNTVALAALIYSWWKPEKRLWPLENRDRKFYLVWGLFPFYTAGYLALGWFTRGGFIFKGLSWDFLGLLLGISGLALYTWAYTYMEDEMYLALESDLVTSGPFRLTRNPQLVGSIMAGSGIVILTNSFEFFIVSLPWIPFSALTPFVEEKWLKNQFGEDYINYCEAVPRFVDRRTFSRFVQQIKGQ